MSKLTIEQVHEIRRLYVPGKVKQVELAERFGVTQVQISQIVLGKLWKDAA